MHDLVEHSTPAGDIVQGEPVGAAMTELREFMFERVYLGPEATREHAKIGRVVAPSVRSLLRSSRRDPDSIPPGALERRVTDYLAGMTDRFCIRTFERLSIPVAFAP